MQDNEPINLTYGQMSDMVNRIEQIPSLSGEGAPTSDTPAFHLGQTYIDTITGDMYYCSDIFDESGGLPQYTWNLATEDVPEYVAGDNVTIEDESGALVISATDTTYSDFTGTDGTAAGTAGLVPAPATTDAGKYLKADGTWDTVQAGPTVAQTTGTSTTDVMSQNATTSMVFDDPSAQTTIKIGAAAAYKINLGSGAYTYSYGGIAIGPSSNAPESGSIALGYGANASKKGAVAIGPFASAATVGQVDFGVSNSGQTSYGYNSSQYRLLTGLYDPQSAHDAATKGYVDPTTDSSAPTTSTVGRLGQIQIDTTTATAYMCTAVDTVTPSYTWKALTA